MSTPVATRNQVLDGLTTTQLSLHTDFPGSLGSAEVTGGTPAYARLAFTLVTAVGGQRQYATPLTFNVPACTVKWVALWDGVIFRMAMPNGGATPQNFMAVPATDLIIVTGHGYADTQKIVFFEGTPPGGISEGTTYFVRDAAADSFKVTATSGGTAIDLTSKSSFSCVVCAIVESVYASQGVHAINSVTVAIPD